ncbi:MAG: MFS transporter [Alphaproteobacteria bacterium]|nr:MAG: MFS transporter [Alphaproteobacteria bacterium]
MTDVTTAGQKPENPENPEKTAPQPDNAAAATAPGTTRLPPSFAWLMGGGFISMLGDQFTIIGLPWLTLKVTGDPFALGIVLAVIGIPRAIFILLGGAIVDKYSPRAVLIISKYVNTVLLGLLAWMVYDQSITLNALYVLAAAIGFASAFAYPAGSSILPFVVPREKLPQANGMMMGMRQVTMFLGPVIAGLVITLFGTETIGGHETIEDTAGLALVFALDALSFLLSAFTLYKVKLFGGGHGAPHESGVWHLLWTGLVAAVRDVEMRTMFLYMGLIQILIGGPIQVGLPVLAETRLDGGAASFGTLIGANGIGMLIGVIIAGAGKGPRWKSVGWMLLSVDCLLGAVLAIFGLVQSTIVGAAILLAIGMVGGMVQVKAFSWLQARTPPAQMGRVMSLFMFIVMGMAPISASAGGWLLSRVAITPFFALCGLTLTLVALLGMCVPAMRRVGPQQTGAA